MEYGSKIKDDLPKKWVKSDAFLAPSDAILALLLEGKLLVPRRNGQLLVCMLHFCPSSKIRQPRYAKGALEGARNT